MQVPSDEEIVRRLVGIISDGFNRSLGTLEAAGAIDIRKVRGHYKGVGSKYYDIVTEQIIVTAQYATPSIRQFFMEADERSAK